MIDSDETGAESSGAPTRRAMVLLGGAVTISLVASGVVLFQSRGLVNSQTIANNAYVAAGALLVLRRPGNRIGPLLVLNGVGWMLVTAGVVTAETLANSGDLDAASWVAWTFALAEPVLIWLMPALMLVFPSGYPESVTRRRLLRAGGVYAAVLIVPTAFARPSLMGRKDRPYPHPFIGDADQFTNVVEPLVTPLILLSLVASIMLVARARHSGPVERRQIEWLGYAAVIYWFVSVTNVMGDPLRHVDEGFYLLDACGMILMPIAVVIAIMKYRLYEIDTIISKSVTYLGLAAAITALYAAIVVVPLLIVGVPDEGGPGLDPPDRRDRGGGGAVRTDPHPDATVGQPPGLRQPRHPPRRPVATHRPAVRHRHRRRDDGPGPTDGRGRRRRAGRRVAPQR